MCLDRKDVKERRACYPEDPKMESLVLCPEELCLGPCHLTSNLIGVSPPAADLTLWSAEALEKGSRFLPWKGTVRSDKLPVFDKLPEFDVSSFFKGTKDDDL